MLGSLLGEFNVVRIVVVGVEGGVWSNPLVGSLATYICDVCCPGPAWLRGGGV